MGTVVSPCFLYRHLIFASSSGTRRKRRAVHHNRLDNMNSTHLNQSPTVCAADRFFRAYKNHCVSPDLDTLINLLNALHSLNDKLRKEHNTDFFSLKEFAALKAIRNLFHHKDELPNEVRIIPADRLPPISTDMPILCLVPGSLVEKAITGIKAKYKPNDEPLVRQALKWYGNIVNINPCIFNFAVHVYERMVSLNILLSSEAYMSFREVYEFEERDGHSHFITGDITCHAGSVNAVLEIAFTD